jgi:UDP-glucose 4-epimerase
MSILVTGGAGYIGSHFVRMLQKNNKKIVIADNLSRGHIESIPQGVDFINVDLKDFSATESIFKHFNIDSIVHFAAYAYVGESVQNPELYYENNVVGSFNLIKAANKANVKKFVFSSTCSLYGNPVNVPISESETTKPINPYAYTKLFIEKILADFETAYGMKYVALRYFNAAGADFDGIIGESHNPEPHLIPIVLFTALKKREFVSIFGNDYNTPDGTCIRDYIHIYDLADAHLKALDYLEHGNKSDVFNLGTGSGYSVKEIIDSAVKITGIEIPYKISERRPGDPDILVADNKKAKNVLGWSPKYSLDDIISSAFNWHKNQKY